MDQDTAFDRLLAVADAHDLHVRVQRDGDAMVQCPAHDDHTPSLHITDNGEGRVLLYCHAGCSTEDILKALDLSPADLFDNRREVTYIYEDGRVVHRKPGKRFHQSGNTEGPAVLYRLSEVRAAIGRGETIYVPEGETDVHAIMAAGGTATCSPMGAGNWDKVDPSPLYGARAVVVPRDKDEAGHRHAAQVVASLADHVGDLTVVEAKAGKDVSDHLQRGYSLDDLVPVVVETPPSLLANLRTGSWLDQQVFPPLRWIVPGLVPEGASLLVGAPKSGKSWLALSLALSVAAGSRALGSLDVQQRPVLLLALEDGDRRIQARSVALLHRDPEHRPPMPTWLSYLTQVEPGLIVPTIHQWLEELDRRGDYPEPLVIVDTLGRVMPRAEPGESDYQRDYRIGATLKRTPDDRPGMGLLVLHHDRKAAAEDFVHSVNGTNGIAGAFDTVLVIRRKRLAPSGTLQVTGRDVPEDEYAITTEHGAWMLDGDTLADAARSAREVHEVGSLGERSQRILRLAEDNPQGIAAAAVAYGLGVKDETARTYLSRLAESGHLVRVERGIYTLPREGVMSVSSVAFGSETTHSTQTQHPDEGASSSEQGRHPCVECGQIVHYIESLGYRERCARCEARTLPVNGKPLSTHPCVRCGQPVNELPERPHRDLCARCRYAPHHEEES